MARKQTSQQGIVPVSQSRTTTAEIEHVSDHNREEDDRERLAIAAQVRQERMEAALRSGRPKNRDRVLLEERLANTVELMALLNPDVIAQGGPRDIRAMLELDSNMREILNDLRGMGSNEESVAYIDSAFSDVLKIMTQQDLNLQKGIKDVVMEQCKPAIANLIIDRVNMLTMSKANLYDDLARMFHERMEAYLDE